VDLIETAEAVLGSGFTCSLVRVFFRALRLIATVPVCRAASGPVAGDLEFELEQSLQFHGGSCLDIRGQLSSLSILWLLGGFLGVRAMNFCSLFGGKIRKICFRKNKRKPFSSYRKQISSFHLYSE